MGVALDEAAGTQYLTFLLADEQYGLNILQVQEIRGWEEVMRVPNAPACVKGGDQATWHDRAGARPA